MLDVIVTNEDVKRNKPHPDCYLFAAAQLRLAPKDIIAVEDSDYGVQAATDAGVRVWRVKNVNDVTAENFERYLDNL
jgi:HAD superfamily hydrolase (TIGR01509 family)